MSQFNDRLENFKSDGTLTADQAESLRNASRFPLNSSEVVAILGGILVFVGAVWLVGPLFEDLGKLVLVAAFYALAAILAFVFKALVKKSQLANSAEIVEVLATLCAAIATGVAVATISEASEVPAFVASIPVLAYGIWRSNLRKFSSSTITATSAVVFVLSGLAIVDVSQDAAGFCLIALSALSLWWAQRSNVRGKFTLRFFASLIAMVGVSIPPSDFGSSQVIPAAIALLCAAGFFAYGVKRLFPEVIAITAVAVVFAEVRLASDISDNSTVQALSTLLTGVVVLSLAMRNLRRKKSTISSS